MKRWMKNCLLCAVAAAAVALLVFTGLQSASLSAAPDRGAMTGENPPALPSDGEEVVGEVTLPDGTTDGTTDDTSGDTIPDDNDVTPIEPEETVPAYTFVGQEGDTYVFRAADGAEESFTFACTEGTAGSVTVSGTTLSLSGLTTDAVYTLSGRLYGNIVVEGNEDYKLELSLCGATIRSEDECPLRITGCDKVTLAAKKDTENYLYDMRAAADTYASAVYADCDLALQGKGALYVYAKENNGVHTKDELTVKNLSLQVECVDNALKGNDSVTVESGTLVLIARQGDGIKTTNTDLSSKGKQRGSVTLAGGDILIYAATDGIVISGGRAVIISTGGGDSAIDTEAGYRYTGGTVVAIGQAGGMSGESTTCSPDFSTVGRSASLRLTSGQYLSVAGLCEVTMPVALNAFVVCLGTTTATIGTVSSLSGTPDGNGVVWL